jgi:hypothetical protein
MGIRGERLIAERGLLQPLPSLRLQIGVPSVLRKVDRLSCVRYGSARYSVPTRLIGMTVAVVVDHGAVCLVEPATGMIVAEHELMALGPRRSSTRTTTGHVRHRVGGHARRSASKNSSATLMLMPRHSWSEQPPSATPASARSWTSCSPVPDHAYALRLTDTLVPVIFAHLSFVLPVVTW